MNNLPDVDRSFDALSHPARRAIVVRLARGPAPVGEATSMLNLSKPAVTKHVKILEGAGLVTRTIVGRTHRLGLAPAGLSHVERWLEYHRRLWESKFDAIERYLERG